ncbi:hypothetical protein [Alistipes ihumii]|jgi:hypothetical protein|uniref:hypothetical protein n=2 Tax=Alistipes ihumii TaxID=1470347 RepID=UPI0039F58F39
MSHSQPYGPQERIKAAFLAGIRMTTAQANRLGQTSDSRKVISRLIKQGMPIEYYWNIRKDDSGRTVAKYKTYYYGSPLPAKGSRMGTFDHPKLDL